MHFPSFTKQDFQTFATEGLSARMEAIQQHIQPKFAAIGEYIATFLGEQIGDTVYTHIAKHARRTVHPPDETWVAWSTNKRGYKAHPHFQFGIRHTQLFVYFALIYECQQKQAFAHQMLQNMKEYIAPIPPNYYVSIDHTTPEITAVNQLTEEGWTNIMQRLAKVKKAEFLCGTIIPRQQAVQLAPEELQQHIEATYQQLLPLYHLSFQTT
jgi:uncharacterized protein YktB (UPF0637 family)